MSSLEQDVAFMRQALLQAQHAYAAGEVPIGAVLVHEERVIAKGYNQVELLQDATAHAEMLCLGSGAAALGNWRLLGATLYCTLEPCPMCAGALFLSRVARVVWGASDARQGAGGSWINLFAQPHPIHRIAATGGILAEESRALLQGFFRQRRQNSSEPFAEGKG